MLCIASLIVFSILGIFSASHRELAKEAFMCTIRRMTLRPCETGFKEKIKGKVLARLLARSVLAAKIFNRYFEALSFVFVALMIVSTVWTARGMYNYFFYGSCNGLNASGFCAFDAKGENNKVTSIAATCGLDTPTEANLDISKVDISLFPKTRNDAKLDVVFIGCYECEYTRRAYQDIKKIFNDKEVNATFMHYPAKHETLFLNNIDYCAYAEDRDNFWILNDILFTGAKENLLDPEYLKTSVKAAGYDYERLMMCATADQTEEAVNKQVSEMEKSGLYGTPTIFIGDKAFVGPKPYRVYWLEMFKHIGL